MDLFRYNILQATYIDSEYTLDDRTYFQTGIISRVENGNSSLLNLSNLRLDVEGGVLSYSFVKSAVRERVPPVAVKRIGSMVRDALLMIYE